MHDDGVSAQRRVEELEVEHARLEEELAAANAKASHHDEDRAAEIERLEDEAHKLKDQLAKLKSARAEPASDVMLSRMRPLVVAVPLLMLVLIIVAIFMKKK